MSGLLFLANVCGFVLIVLWAFKNDGMKPDEFGSGLLAMQPLGPEKQKTVPKWKKSGFPARPMLAAVAEKKPSKARWQKSLHYGKDH